MGTVLNKLFFGAIFLFLSWKGIDGLLINIFHSTSQVYDIALLEQSGEIESRNLVIQNGIPVREELMYYQTDSFSPIDIIYPLVSSDQIEKYSNSEPINVKALVLMKDQSWGCLETALCIPADSSEVSGIVRVGLENLNSADLTSIESELVTFEDNLVYLEPDMNSIKLHWNLLMFIGGSLFGLAILKSFFRKASSLNEYWAKITEKEERKNTM